MSFRKTAAVGVALGWVLATAVAASGEDRGQVVFNLCTQCHQENGAGDPVALAPGIAGLGEWYVLSQLNGFRGGLRGAHFDDIPGMRMRPMSLTLRSDEDVEAVAAYVASLPQRIPEPTLEGGDPVRGQALYAVCSACHGPDGKGNESVRAPSLVHTGDWYLFSTLKRYQTGARGSNPLDQYGAVMRSMSMTLPDDQAILDVVAYVTQLGGSD